MHEKIISIGALQPFQPEGSIVLQTILLHMLQSYLRRRFGRDIRVVGGTDIFGDVAKCGESLVVRAQRFPDLYDQLLALHRINRGDFARNAALDYLEDLPGYPKVEMRYGFLHTSTLNGSLPPGVCLEVAPTSIAESLVRRVVEYQQDRFHFLDEEYFESKEVCSALAAILNRCGLTGLCLSIGMTRTVPADLKFLRSWCCRVILRVPPTLFVGRYGDLQKLVVDKKDFKVDIEIQDGVAANDVERVETVCDACPEFWNRLSFPKRTRGYRTLRTRAMIRMIETTE